MLSTVCAKFAHQTHAGAKIMASPSRVFLAMGAIAPSNWRLCLIRTQFSFHLCLTGKFFFIPYANGAIQNLLCYLSFNYSAPV